MSGQGGGRFGAPLTRADAEALAGKWANGFIISDTQRAKEARGIIELVEQARQAGIIGLEDLYPEYTRAMEFMREKGLNRLEVEADPAMVTQTNCEDECARQTSVKCQDGTWSQLDCESYYRECLRRSCASEPPYIPPPLDQDEGAIRANPQADTDLLPLISLPSPSTTSRSSRPASAESAPTPETTPEQDG